MNMKKLKLNNAQYEALLKWMKLVHYFALSDKLHIVYALKPNPAVLLGPGAVRVGSVGSLHLMWVKK